VDLTRTARARGPSGLQLWVGSSLLIAWGFYRVGVMNQERSNEKLEERKARFMMASYLQAEEDRWYVERENEIRAKEAEIMKNVSGWKVGESVYLSDRWVPRQSAQLDKNLKK
jgi:NADH dehydrogenase (ubiquinone) 1 alpha subcomplex subunit 13